MARTKTPSKTVLKRLRAQLEDEQEQLREQLRELEASADIRQWSDGGFDDDAADTGAATYERERAQSLANHSRKLLTQIEDALARMDDGSYGVCQRCGEPIGLARLEALPYATLCVEDKQRDEHGR